MPFTLASPCEYQEIIRKSRFLTHAAQVDTPEQALAFIQRISDPSASHNCWAWKIGNLYRFSDDGEPGGTAGRPMLTAIEGQDCDRLVVVTTRWFGGIQLGTGGLARAYGGSVAKCLQASVLQPLVTRVHCSCHCRFNELPILKSRLQELEALLEAEHFDAEGATLELALPGEKLQDLQVLLSDISRGRSRLQVAE
ncbi:IMPACT family protein [Stutzerimonas kirkiae]|uniref:Thymidylate synthase n=1 Tax=Stutzerimonas kirkiae TaxID=2211392 RepID=A0A4Q9R8N4_9GAMM|nr:YigZ family protein [Stutzerimonas kirkiae]TBU96289.1 thymidylate synthase [Stutzerimonas kirkiae]TBV03368.1 thymidylate synthase [Stutzerimonas kirkiae]TBV04742.1 thymidylate synthase [Stutzerimonas kirkiae]